MKEINLLVFFGLCIALSQCFYFDLILAQHKCLYEMYPEGTNIIINYNIPDITPQINNPNRFLITIKEKNQKKEIHSFNSNKSKGKFSYSIEKSGPYKICFYTKDKSDFIHRSKLKLDFIVDDGEDFYAEAKNVPKMKDFEKVDEKVKHIKNKVENIDKMQIYQIRKEATFARNQIKNSKRIATISIIQIVIILIIGVMHIISLRKLFKEKVWMPF